MTLDYTRYYRMFVEEAQEYLQQMMATLTRLQENPRQPELWQEMYRYAHSIKGMAGTLGLQAVQELAHVLEDFMQWIQQRNDVTAHFPVLTEALEQLAEQIRQVDTRSDAVPSTVPPVVDRLRARMRDTTPPSAPPPPAPSAPESPPASEPETQRTQRTRWQGLVRLQADVVLPAARMMVIVRALETVGTITALDPSREQIQHGQVGQTLRFTLEGPEDVTALEQTLRNIPDVSAVEIRPLRPQPETEAEEPATSVLPNTVRVRLEDVDRLFDLASAMFMQIQRLRSSVQPRTLEDATLLRDSEFVARQIYLGLMDLRMLPLETLIPPLRRMAERLAEQMGKRVKMVTRGEHLAVDKTILEYLMDPLVHIVRNCVDHGIEPPEERTRKGKPPEGYISIHARSQGDWIHIVILDDGRGMNLEKIAQQAIERGLVTPDQLRTMTPEEVCMLVTIPGFSTATAVTAVSGRGIGMDVVRHRVESLGGMLRIETKKDRGTRITIQIPARLSILDTIIVRHDQYMIAIPMERVYRILPAEHRRVHYRQQVPVLYLDERMAPIVTTDEVLLAVADRPASWHRYYFVVLTYEQGVYTLAVPDIVGEHHSVVQRLEPPLSRIPIFSGITVSPNLEVIPLLDVEFIGQQIVPHIA